ncbi:MAG: hypothetical protein KAT25_03560 [Sulfuriflexus sp.]|nr:hypothetical protein [Sulfuriflexus sp.]
MSRELIAEKLKDAMGLHAPTVGMVTVSSAIDRRMRACNITNSEKYLSLIITSPTEIDELIEEVIIPETWFFRENQPYEYILNYFQEQPPSKKINILSIPCSTGEEPYSIAMMLVDNDIHKSRYSIDAVDIAVKNIDKANIAQYRKNSFRSNDLRFVDKYFKKNNGLFSLTSDIKEKVNFHCENVLNDTFSLECKSYDIIFCRNLLIYFDEDTQSTMFSRLDKLLQPEGMLVLGHAETIQHANDRFVSAVGSKFYIYVKSSNLDKPLAEEHKKRTTDLLIQNSRQEHKKNIPRPFSASRETDKKERIVKSISPDGQLDVAFRLANKGDLDGAMSACNNYLSENRSSSRAYYLSGVIYDTQGSTDKANEFLNKAIYLDPNNLEALIHLSLLAEQSGNHDDAIKYKNRAQRVKERRTA